MIIVFTTRNSSRIDVKHQVCEVDDVESSYETFQIWCNDVEWYGNVQNDMEWYAFSRIVVESWDGAPTNVLATSQVCSPGHTQSNEATHRGTPVDFENVVAAVLHYFPLDLNFQDQNECPPCTIRSIRNTNRLPSFAPNLFGIRCKEIIQVSTPWANLGTWTFGGDTWKFTQHSDTFRYIQTFW